MLGSCEHGYEYLGSKAVNLILYNFQTVDEHKQVHHRQIALAFEFKAFIHVSATVRSCLQGLLVLKKAHTTLL